MSISLLTVAGAAGLASWVAVLVAPWRPWSCRERLEMSAEPPEPVDLSDVTAVIPARNEAEVIGRTLRGLARQGPGLGVVLVDDGSSDGTGRIARETASGRGGEGLELEVVNPGPTPAGWTGKLWALESGRGKVGTPLVLFLDADVELDAGVVPELRSRLRGRELQMVSLMVAPRMEGPWESLLMPAFVWFFKLLYPFGLVNDARSRVAAAAGGCVLVQSRVVERAGGLASIRSEIIDDCALARRVKTTGGRIWIGLTRSARSVRPRAGLGDIWDMVARTAYAQLRYSPPLLTGCTVIMVAAFWGPPTAVSAGGAAATVVGASGLGCMVVAYLPTLRYYGRSPAWALLLPVTATLYLAMTWTSAVRHWWGRGARWKGRSYGAEGEHRGGDR